METLLGEADFFRSKRVEETGRGFPPFVVEFDLTTYSSSEDNLVGIGMASSVLSYLSNTEREKKMFEVGNRLKEVVLRFRLAEDKEEFKEELKWHWSISTLSPVDSKRRERLIKWEVDEGK